MRTAAPVWLSAIALILVAGCSGGSERHEGVGGTLAPTETMPTPTAPPPVVTSLAPSTAVSAPRSIRNALEAAGATLNQAPAAIGSLLDTSTCGLVRITNKSSLERIPGASERRCFLDSLVTQRLASVVTMADSVEGAPVVITDVVLADGSVATFHDSTRDPLSSRGGHLGAASR